MEQNKFAAILPVLIAGLADKIIAETAMSEDEAFNKLYNSKLYEFIENEQTKVWTFSIQTLYQLYNAEQTTGVLDFPDY